MHWIYGVNPHKNRGKWGKTYLRTDGGRTDGKAGKLISSEGYKLIYDISEEIKHSIGILEQATGISIKSMRVAGGQAHNEHWNQYKADRLGISIETTQLLDAELTGDAIIAFTSMGFFSSIEEGVSYLKNNIQPPVTLFLKASRSMKFENIISGLNG